MPPESVVPKLRVVEQQSDTARLDSLTDEVSDIKKRLYDPDTGLYTRITQTQTEMRTGFLGVGTKMDGVGTSVNVLATKVDAFVASTESLNIKAMSARLDALEKTKGQIISGMTWFCALILTGATGAGLKAAFDVLTRH